MGRDSSARRAASADHGLIDRSTARAAGLTDTMVKTRVDSERWTRIHGGVYQLDVTTPSWESQVRAATLAGGPAALASHRTAAILFGLDGLQGRVVELTVPYSNRPIPDGVIVHRTRRLLPSTTIRGIPITAPERTLLDLASILPAITLEKAVMSAFRIGLTTPDEVAITIREQGGRGVRGVKKLRRVLLLTDEGVSGSASEVDAASLMRDAPIPTPHYQYEISLPGGSRAYPDFAWPALMKLVEIDGMDGHGSADQLHKDLIRQNALLELGWEVRRFSARSLQREPGRVIDEIVRFVDPRSSVNAIASH